LVIGGGDTAIEEALYLGRLTSSVTVVHWRQTLRANRALRERAARQPNLRLLLNRTVARIFGDGVRVVGARLRDADTGQLSDVETDAVFVAIGRTPATELVSGQPRSTRGGTSSRGPVRH
jgi:thioredoxin reductase (NADPH)